MKGGYLVKIVVAANISVQKSHERCLEEAGRNETKGGRKSRRLDICATEIHAQMKNLGEGNSHLVQNAGQNVLCGNRRLCNGLRECKNDEQWLQEEKRKWEKEQKACQL